MSNDSDVLLERVRATQVVTFNRAEHGNSVHGTLFRDIVEAFEAADRDDEVRAVVTTGAGYTYCVGADRDEFGKISKAGGFNLHELGFQGDVGGDWGLPETSRNQQLADTVGVGRWVHRMVNVGTPTIAAINGGTAGGGLALALLHDYRIASTKAKFVPAFIALGVSPEMGLSYFLPRLVGYATAFDLMTRTKPIDADEALELGLVNQVVEAGELREAALARADEFAKFPGPSVAMVKKLLRQSTQSTLDDQLEREWHNQTRLFGLPEAGPHIKAYLDQF